MKKIAFLLLTIITLLSCEGDRVNRRNPYIPNYAVNLELNLSLPTYNTLQFTGNALLINTGNSGLNGVIVFNTGNGIVAFDATCPNQIPTSCSRLEISIPHLICPCDGVQYNLYTGLPNADLEYPLKQYRVTVAGNIIRITN
ncbi:hypothetical protein GV828_01095 [Flavobacterium sp. NST-5]|uniref:Rieske domain-containing protein n=1 Tax=Flavobacterium ichthyis TaxID=2698827 RepID=A0ABW9Z529_9FLAO|nr:hypothetical protein [Flavobacterium ichthyis]NBL63789.1 hypothetical protein [Flavobacterium ichthyis]